MNEQAPVRAAHEQTAEDQDQQMTRFGITTVQRSVYQYKGYVYERLSDALAYATIDTAREAATSGRPTS